MKPLEYNDTTSMTATSLAMRKAKSFDPSTESSLGATEPNNEARVLNGKKQFTSGTRDDDGVGVGRSSRWKNRLRPGLRRSTSVPEDRGASPSKRTSGQDTAPKKVAATFRRQTLRRTTSVPETFNDPSINRALSIDHTPTIIPVEKSTYRLRRRNLLTFRSNSMPMEHVRREDDSDQEEQILGIQSTGGLRVRQTLPVDGEPNMGSISSQKTRLSNSIRLQRKDSASKELNNSTKGSVSDDSTLNFSEENNSEPPRISYYNDMDDSILRRTQVVPHYSSSDQTRTEATAPREQNILLPAPLCNCSCSTSILQHSYLEMVCGRFDFDDEIRLSRLPEDPTVQESIECIFASQLEEGLKLWDDEEEDEFVSHTDRSQSLVSPTGLLQSRENRYDRSIKSGTQKKKIYQQGSLRYVGSYDPAVPGDSIMDEKKSGDALPCPCSQSPLPLMQPRDWPQGPLLLRPTPGSGTIVKGVRFGGSKEKFWVPGSQQSWSNCLAEHWGSHFESQPITPCCGKCAILPINNGNEPHGESLVIDFETDLFVGSFLLRLRFAEGTTNSPYDDSKGYFKGMNRRYQAVVRGRFKKPLPLTELVTGFQLERPCGQLPPKWIVRGGLKVVSFFAPQLKAKFDCKRPYSLTPLGSTPQSITVERKEADMLEDKREEPKEASMTLLGETSLATSSMQRARARKKAFDKLYVQQVTELKTDPNKIYTFEFLQHLFNFQDFSVELGSMLGSVNLEEILDGQPLQIMAGHGAKPLWSFEVWHQCLWERAKHHELNSTKSVVQKVG